MDSSYFSGPPSPSYAESVTSSYNHGDVVQALMTHLRERDAELKKARVEISVARQRQQVLERHGNELEHVVNSQRTLLQQTAHENMTIEQLLAETKRERDADLEKANNDINTALGREVTFERNGVELQRVVDSQHILLHQKSQIIFSLEQLVVQKESESKVRESVMSEKVVEVEAFLAEKKTLGDNKKNANNLISKQMIELNECADNISKLTSEVEEIKVKQNTTHAFAASLQEKFKESETKLEQATDEILSVRAKLETEEKKVKSKEWIIGSLKVEHEDQRKKSKFNIQDLNKIIEFYENECKGKGADVPGIIARQNQFHDDVKELENKMQQLILENEKLNLLAAEKFKKRHEEDENKIKQLMRENEKLDSLAMEKSKKCKASELREMEMKEKLMSAVPTAEELICRGQFINVSETVASSVSETATCTFAEYDEEFDRERRKQATSFDTFIDDVQRGIDSLKDEGLCLCD